MLKESLEDKQMCSSIAGVAVPKTVDLGRQSQN